MSSLATTAAEALAPGGAVARSLDGFAPRTGQQRMTAAVARAVEERSAAVIEAGTGIGKTYAYLVPLLLSGQRALVSTATKSLQDQLFWRDLPRLREALAVPARLALLKGRGNYLCRHRLTLALEQGQLPDRASVRVLARIRDWAPVTRSGDLAEVPGLDERSPVVPLVSSTKDNCLGGECPEFADCHVMKARREAMAADLVVVNHHLFFADLVLRDSGVAELLPSVDAVVFDEAHQLVDAGVQFMGVTLGSAALLELVRDALAGGLQHARGLQDWTAYCAALEAAVKRFRLACLGDAQAPRSQARLALDELADSVDEPLRQLGEACVALGKALSSVAEAAPDLGRLALRAQEQAQLVMRFRRDPAPDHVRWMDLGPHHVRLVESPLDLRKLMSEQREAGGKAWIFTSATLGDDEDLSWFSSATAQEDAVKLRLPSPFDYARQARLWVPPRCPRPNEARHPAAVGTLAARCAHRLGGRCFVLTTTLRVLPLIAQAMRDWMRRYDADLELLVQGDQPRRALLQRYGDGAGRVLIGSASFWEGIDMPGDALQCVLVDKLPFPPPHDPLVQARVRRLQAAGGDPFAEYFVAEAAVALKQGAGRLIRSETDRGLLVVCDPRLSSMAYGRRLRAALPPMGLLGDDMDAGAWLAELAAARDDA